MSNQNQNLKVKKIYDLAERTSKLGGTIILFARDLPDNIINRPLISQLVRVATSIGANYMEADGAESKRDFVHKIGLCKKEAKETTHWLHMIAIANSSQQDRCRKLWQEAHELVLIFSSIIKKK